MSSTTAASAVSSNAQQRFMPPPSPGWSQLPAFDADEGLIDMARVAMGSQIGQGAFSKVYVGRYQGGLVAIKKQRRVACDELEPYLLRELSVLKHFRHPNLLTYVGAGEVATDDPGVTTVYIITELAPHGDLLGLLLGDYPLGWKVRTRILLDASRALEFLHSKRLIHRDIKSANMLLDGALGCKLADFGMARPLGSNMTVVGTDAYIAPEIMYDEDYDSSADMFSLGVVAWECIYRRRANADEFMERSPSDQFLLDTEELSANAPRDAPTTLVSLAANLCEAAPDTRPTAEDAHMFLDDAFDDLPADAAGTDGGDLPPIDYQALFDAETNSVVSRGGGGGEDGAEAAMRFSSAASDSDSNVSGLSAQTVQQQQQRHAHGASAPDTTAAAMAAAAAKAHRRTTTASKIMSGGDGAGFASVGTQRPPGQTRSPKVKGYTGDKSRFVRQSPTAAAAARAALSPPGTRPLHSVASAPTFQTRRRSSEPQGEAADASAAGGAAPAAAAQEQQAVAAKGEAGAGTTVQTAVLPPAPRTSASPPRGRTASSRLSRDVLSELGTLTIPTKKLPHHQAPGHSRFQSTLRGASHAPITMCGYLNKKRKTGLRTWKRRWFVLEGTRLIWYRDKASYPKEPKGVLELAGTFIVRGKQCRWTIFSATGSAQQQENARELAASDTPEMEQWLTALQNAMDAADTGEGLPEHIDTQLGPVATIAALIAVEDFGVGRKGGLGATAPVVGADGGRVHSKFLVQEHVEDWLLDLGLTHLAPRFAAAGYNDMLLIQEMGLHREDLAFIGVPEKAERRQLMAAAQGVAANMLMLSISGYFNFGKETVFRVESQWRFLRANTHFTLLDFEDLHKKLKAAMRDTKFAKMLPSLPQRPVQPLTLMGMQGLDRAAQMTRLQQGLHRYMTRLASVVGTKEPFFTILCGYLDLLPFDPRRLPDRSEDFLVRSSQAMQHGTPSRENSISLSATCPPGTQFAASAGARDGS